MKTRDLADARSGSFLTVSSTTRSGGDTDQGSVNRKKRKVWGVTGNKVVEVGRVYVVTISVPWGGSRRYATTIPESSPSATMAWRGHEVAVARALARDGRVPAAEVDETVLIGVRQVEQGSIKPKLRQGEVRLLLNTER